MEELVKLLLEEAEAEERFCWYASGYSAESGALQALVKVLERVQQRLKDGV